MKTAPYGVVRWLILPSVALLVSCAHIDSRSTLVEEVLIKIVPVGTPPPEYPYQCIRNTDVLLCVSRDPIEPPGGTFSKNTIPWRIETSGWTFDPKKGIDIRPGGHWDVTAGPGEPPNGPTTFQAEGRKNGKWYKYTINIKQQGITGRELSWDPSIMN